MIDEEAPDGSKVMQNVDMQHGANLTLETHSHPSAPSTPLVIPHSHKEEIIIVIMFIIFIVIITVIIYYKKHH